MSRLDEVKKYVMLKIGYLQKVSEKGNGKAELALLRKGVGKYPGEIPLLYGSFLNQLPEELQGKGENASRGEWAVYAALTLYALHQQGQSQSMQKKGASLGKALRGLIPKGDQDAENRILRRFNQMATAADMTELTYHLRGIVELLRSKGIPLDYVDLAGDLYLYQAVENQNQVRLKWGRGFYAFDNQQETVKEENHE